MKKHLQNFNLGRFSRLALSFCLVMVMAMGVSWGQTTSSITFGSSSGSTNINSVSVTGNDGLDNTWTITTVGTTSFTPNSDYAQVGSSKKPATSITFTTTLPEEVNVTAMEAKFGGFSGTAGTVTMKVGNTTIGTGSLNATNDVVVNSTSTATGNVLTVTVTNISKGVKCYYISYTYETVSSTAVATTTAITAPNDFNNDIYTSFTAGTLMATVTETANNTPVSGATVSWSSSNPSVATVDENGAVTLVAVGTTNITASYAGVTDQYQASSATYPLTVINSNAPGTVNNPYTVAQARAAIDASTGTQGVYATGVVSAIPTAWNSQYSNITFNFVDEEGDTDFLQAYRCTSGTGVDASTVAVGDTVVVYGNLTKYGSTYEFGQGCELVSLTHPIHDVETPSFSPVAGTYATAQDVTISCATDGSTIYYTIDGTEPTNTSTQYSTPIEVSGTTTIKAIAYVGNVASTVAMATYHINSQENPYTVAQALAFNEYPANGIYVSGIVSTAPTLTPTDNGELTYYISDDGTTTDELEVYKGKGLEQAAFTAQDDLQVGDIVIIYGNVQVYNNTIEFGTGNYLVSFERPVAPSVTVTPNTIIAPAIGVEDSLVLTYENIADFISFDYYFCDANGDELQEEPDWIYAEIHDNNDNYSLVYLIDANDGAARTAYIKVYTFDDELEEVYFIVTVNQAEYVAPIYAELPFSFNDVRSAIETTDGLSQEGLGTDYNANNNPTTKLKFDGTGDWLLLQFNERPGTLTFDIKGNSFSGGTFKVQTSEDGTNYTDLQTYTSFGSDVESEEFTNLDAGVRYIKWIYTEKSSGNVGLGNIALAKYVAPQPVITLSSYSIEAPAAETEGTLTVTYTEIETGLGASIYWFESDGVTSASEPDWMSAEINAQLNVGYLIEENDGAARTAYFKVYGVDENLNDVYSDLVTVSQAAASQQYTLTIQPFENLELITFVNDEMVMEGDGNIQVNEGDQIMLSIVALEGYEMETLMVNGVNHVNDIAADFTYSFEMPAENVTISATAVESVAPVAGNYVRITSLDQLTDGSKVIIAARYDEEQTNGYYAMPGETSGKPNGVLFTSETSGNNEILPAAIATSEDTYYWTVNVTEDGYTFTNANNYLIGYPNSGTDFSTGNHTVWNVTRETAENSAMVAGYTGFVIRNGNTDTRAFAFNGTVFGAYSTTANIAASGYNFFLDFFVESDETPSSDPTITVTPATIDAPVAGAQGVLTVTYTNITEVSAGVQFCNAQGEAATYDWIIATLNSENNIEYTVSDNTGAARTAYFKVYAPGDAGNVYSNLVTVTQAAYVAPHTVYFYEGTGDCNTVSLTGSSVELPTATISSNEWTFAGWAEAPTNETNQRPTLYLAGSIYTPEQDINLYAVYTKTQSSGGSAVYQKVTSEPSDWNGEYLIVYEDVDLINMQEPDGLLAFNGNLINLDVANNYKSIGYNAYNESSSTILANDSLNSYVFTISSTDNNEYTVQTVESYYIGQTSDANGLFVSETTQYANSIHYDSEQNCVNIVCAGAYLRYNYASNQQRFRYYKSSSYTNQQPIQLYKLSSSTTSSVYNSFPTIRTTSLNDTEGFETYSEEVVHTRTNVKPTGWTVVRHFAPEAKTKTGRPQVYNKPVFSHDSRYSLVMDSLCIIAMPELSSDIVDLSQVEMELYVRQPYDYQYVEVGVMSDLTDPESFVTVSTINNVGSAVNRRVVDFSGYTGTGRYIAFRNGYTEEQMHKSFNYIDDITLTISQSLCGITSLSSATWGFESEEQNTSEVETCWTLVNRDNYNDTQYDPQIVANTHYANSGQSYLKLDGECTYAMPKFMVEGKTISEVQVEFYVRQYSANCKLQVGVLSNKNNPSTFVLLETISNEGASGYYRHVTNFSSYASMIPSEAKYIAFRNVYEGNWGRSINYIDDITISEPEEQSECGIIELPSVWGFEAAETVEPEEVDILSCWTLVNRDKYSDSQYDPRILSSAYYANSGQYSLKLDGECLYAMPEFQVDGKTISEVQMEFSVRQYSANCKLRVGVMSDVNNPSTFIELSIISNANASEYQHYVIDFSNYANSIPNDAKYIAFRNFYEGTWGRSINYIDDIILSEPEETSNCGITELPSVWGFEDEVNSETGEVEDVLSCWTLVKRDKYSNAQYDPKVNTQAYYSHGGQNNLKLDGEGLYAMPEFKVPGKTLQEVRVEFNVRQYSANCKLRVGVMSDVDNPNTFTELAVISNEGVSGYQNYVLDFSTLAVPSDAKYIAFRNYYEGNWGRSINYLDDITISLITTDNLGDENGNNTEVAQVHDTNTEDAEFDSYEENNEEPFNAPTAISSFSESQLSLYPNPTSGKVTLVADEVTMVEVYSQIGSKVATFTLNNERVIDLGNLPKGVYILRVTMPQGVAVRKVVKN